MYDYGPMTKSFCDCCQKEIPNSVEGISIWSMGYPIHATYCAKCFTDKQKWSTMHILPDMYKMYQRLKTK